MILRALNVFLVLIIFYKLISAEKTIDKEYKVFLNFGDQKLMKTSKSDTENAILKKVDVLGDIFKKKINEIKKNDKLDLVFLIDASSSVGEENFHSEVKFVKTLLSDITVDYNHTRIAVITFSSINNIVSTYFLYIKSYISIIGKLM